MLASLRNPVERAFSYYEMSISKRREKPRSFEQWMDGNKFWLECGGYAGQLQRYIDLFGQENLKIVLFEDIQERLQDTIVDIHRFLGVTEMRPEVKPMTYNKGGLPRGIGGALLYRATTMRGLNRMLRPFVPAAVVTMVHRVRNRAVASGTITPATRQRLIAYFRDDILRTQDIIGRDLGHWLDADR